MKKYTFSCMFWMLKHRQNKNGEQPIYIRITINGQRSEASMNRWLLAQDWDQNKQIANKRTEAARSVNAYLEMTKGKLQQIFNQLLSTGEDITADKIKNLWLGKEIKPKSKTIIDCFDYHNLKMKDLVEIEKVTTKTLMRYEITKNKVQAFMKEIYQVNDMPLPEIRLKFVTEFEHFLLTTQRIQSNTAHKYIKNLKKIMNMAVGLDWIPSNPFNQFKCSYTSPEREILNEDELFHLTNKKIVVERLNEVRDVFVFCCYTGFAYSDVYQFERNAVIKGLDGELWLSTLRQKTGTKESVPLLPMAMEIINKYQNHPYCVKNNKLLPVNSNQRYNAYLKELADICGIEKTLTSHIARHTFATTVTLANGVPIETVSSMLGHTNIRTTQIYAKVVEQKVSSDMQLLKEKLLQKTIQLSKVV